MIYDISNASDILRGREKLEVQRELKVAELDNLFKGVLNDLQSKAIAKYRSFCTQNYISNKTEIDMESVNYSALRAELVEESKALHKKYSQPQAFLAGSEKEELKNKKEDSIGEMINKMISRDY